MYYSSIILGINLSKVHKKLLEAGGVWCDKFNKKRNNSRTKLYAIEELNLHAFVCLSF